MTLAWVDHTGSYLAYSRGRDVIVRPLDWLGSSRNDRVIGRHDHDIEWLVTSDSGEFLATGDESGETRVWLLESNSKNPLKTLTDFRGVTGVTSFDNSGEVRNKLYLLQIKGNGFVELKHN